jgi:hypothetical protein
MSNIQNTQTNQTTNRGAILKVLARLATTGLISFGIGGAVTFDRYNNYWNQTIFRVQTVDFNILSHTLPTKLSYALIKNQPEEVQRTLNSNYNLFGLIVTDSSGQEIIAYSGKDSGKPSSWKAALNPQELKKHPYDVLLDPPPVFAQWTYNSSRDSKPSATEFTNQGRVIGRVYYVRGVRPTFQQDLMTLLSNPFSGSSRIQTYSTTLVACFGATLLIWSGLEFMLYKKRIDKKERDELIDNNQILQSQLSERINELQSLQKQRDDERNELIKDADNLRSSNNRLKQEIAKLSESIKDLPNNTDSELQTELEKTKLQSKQNLAKKKQYEQHIQKLTQQLEIVHRKQVEHKESQIQELQEQINNTESQLTELQNNEENYQETIKILENQLNDKNSREIELQKQLENLQSSLSEYEEREQLLEQRAKQVKDESDRLAEEMERYIEETGQHPLNDFEVAIKECLEHNFSNARIEIQFDVGTGKQGSRFTDFILVTKKYCIIIEAKSYTGKIKPIDNVRNSGWICERGNQRIHIFSCWGKNPYQQIKTYCDSLMKNRGLGINSRLPIYGIVVFPKGSCIDNSIQSNVSGFYRITTLDNFTTDIQKLENQAQFN